MQGEGGRDLILGGDGEGPQGLGPLHKHTVSLLRSECEGWGLTASALSLVLIHRSAWKVNPRKFVAPTLETLEGEHPVGLCSKPRYVGGCRPSAIDDCRAVLRRPTGERAALSDIHGDLVLP